MNEPTIDGRRLHRVDLACCTRNCRQGRSCPRYRESADEPLVTPEQAMGWAPTWVLGVIAAVLFIVLIVQRTS